MVEVFELTTSPETSPNGHTTVSDGFALHTEPNNSNDAGTRAHGQEWRCVLYTRPLPSVEPNAHNSSDSSASSSYSCVHPHIPPQTPGVSYGQTMEVQQRGGVPTGADLNRRLFSQEAAAVDRTSMLNSGLIDPSLLTPACTSSSSAAPSPTNDHQTPTKKPNNTGNRVKSESTSTASLTARDYHQVDSDTPFADPELERLVQAGIKKERERAEANAAAGIQEEDEPDDEKIEVTVDEEGQVLSRAQIIHQLLGTNKPRPYYSEVRAVCARAGMTLSQPLRDFPGKGVAIIHLLHAVFGPRYGWSRYLCKLIAQAQCQYKHRNTNFARKSGPSRPKAPRVTKRKRQNIKFVVKDEKRQRLDEPDVAGSNDYHQLETKHTVGQDDDISMTDTPDQVEQGMPPVDDHLPYHRTHPNTVSSPPCNSMVLYRRPVRESCENEEARVEHESVVYLRIEDAPAIPAEPHDAHTAAEEAEENTIDMKDAPAIPAEPHDAHTAAEEAEENTIDMKDAPAIPAEPHDAHTAAEEAEENTIDMKEAPADAHVDKEEAPADAHVDKEEAPADAHVDKEEAPADAHVDKEEAPADAEETTFIMDDAPAETQPHKENVPAAQPHKEDAQARIEEIQEAQPHKEDAQARIEDMQTEEFREDTQGATPETDEVSPESNDALGITYGCVEPDGPLQMGPDNTPQKDQTGQRPHLTPFRQHAHETYEIPETPESPELITDARIRCADEIDTGGNDTTGDISQVPTNSGSNDATVDNTKPANVTRVGTPESELSECPDDMETETDNVVTIAALPTKKSRKAPTKKATRAPSKTPTKAPNKAATQVSKKTTKDTKGKRMDPVLRDVKPDEGIVLSSRTRGGAKR
ncbi:hypothetical protein BJ508DRAFT_333554 [Ascobolus immersus RN42]|uniref:Uncharacterized protein n=1 Tax=Ascobolus immersus RN42 TaxID=1160509 RepID=A0A3N4HJ91_ASCIM|nr:hypothetical protein BJ508DRAFT_333554 [Ascobolus immersus RN42]